MRRLYERTASLTSVQDRERKDDTATLPSRRVCLKNDNLFGVSLIHGESARIACRRILRFLTE